jgi:signal transduction histidine kinase
MAERFCDETASERDQAAQKRDELAAGRDRESDIAERRVLDHEGPDGASGGRPMSQVQELQARSLEDHRRAAGDRVSAKQDREFGERDRAQSRRDRELALEDGRSLALAERMTRDLAHQRTQLINAQSIGQFGSWEWDVATDRTVWSSELYRTHGRDPSDATMSFDDYILTVHEGDRDAVQAQVKAAFATGESFSFEHRIIRSDGAVRVLHARGEVVMAADGTPVTMRGTAQDITERREVERAKDEFISVVSHELRTPLTSIRGSLGLLESGVVGPLPERARRMIEIAVQNTDRLVRLINDILDIERIDSATIDLHPQPCDGAELIRRAIQGLEQFATDAHVRLTADDEPVALSADPDRIHQTLTNLISNAVKFSPASSTVHVSCTRRDDGVLFEVADHGKGIPADKLASIFERFQQVDASDSRDKGGTGLGLAISRNIVEHHGGRIWVDSQLGAGSTFSFILPAQQPVRSPRVAAQVTT